MLTAQYQPWWTPAAQRPPQPDADILDQYLCWINDGEDVGPMVLEWDGEHFLLDSTKDVTRDVSHWMPVPGSPTGQ